jgi:hypothetical protein
MTKAIEKKQKMDEMQDVAEKQILQAAKLVRFNVIDYSLEHLVKKVKDKEYYVPAYQREFTWDKKKKSRFIESVMIGLPIPFLFFWQDADGNFEIVDGSQRLRTLEEFVNKKFKLCELSILTSLKGMTFNDLSVSRRRKFISQSIRGILLENDTSTSTRTEMFNRINTGGSIANEAEVRRGSLPGLVTDLVVELANNEQFIGLTPITKSLVDKREREELVVRFLAYTSRVTPEGDNNLFIGYRDKPREFIYEYLEAENLEASEDENVVVNLRNSFVEMMDFVTANFPNGFQKPTLARQIPRARYEAIAIGCALAIKRNPLLIANPPSIEEWIDREDFVKATTSDGANTRSKLEGRIKFVRDNILGAI